MYINGGQCYRAYGEVRRPGHAGYIFCMIMVRATSGLTEIIFAYCPISKRSFFHFFIILLQKSNLRVLSFHIMYICMYRYFQNT